MHVKPTTHKCMYMIVCVNLDFSWPAVLNVSKRSQMMKHFHKDLFSKIYYSPMQLHIAFETGDRNVLKKK